MAKRQLNSTEVITESSSEASRLQRVLSSSVLLFCIIKDKSIVLMFPWEIQLLPSLFPGRESDSTKCEKLGKKTPHFPPKAASASFSDLITASYEISVWQSKRSKIPFWVPFSCLSAHQGIVCTWSHWRLGRSGWGGQTDFASPPAFLLHSMVTDRILKSSFITDFCLFKDLLGALQKWKAGHVLCAPALKPLQGKHKQEGTATGRIKCIALFWTWLFPLSCAALP